MMQPGPATLSSTPPQAAELPPSAPFTLPLTVGGHDITPDDVRDDDLTPFTDIDGAAAADAPFGMHTSAPPGTRADADPTKPLPRPVSTDLDLHTSVTTAHAEKEGQQAEVERLKEELLRLQMLMSRSSNDEAAGTVAPLSTDA
jgi:hypothetical protein